jgi:hypothetical protein
MLILPLLPLHLSLTSCTCRIIPNAAEFEGMPSFVEANLSPSFDQGKNRASSLYKILLYNIYIMLMIVHLCIGIRWNHSCTKNTLTNPLCLPL